MTGFPLLAIVVALYSLLAWLAPGWLATVQIEIPLLSGQSLGFQGGDLLLVLGLILLCVEVYRATSSSGGAILNHVLSLVVFIIALVELLVVPQLGSIGFFLIVLMTLSDVIAGFTVTISSSRRDWQRWP